MHKAIGLLTRTPTGIAATLTDAWGYVYTLTGTRAPGGGYAIDIVMTGVPEDIAVPGDEEHFEVIRA